MEEFNSYIKNFPDYPIRFDSSVVRGLDYYTGMIFEAELLVDIKNAKEHAIPPKGGKSCVESLISSLFLFKLIFFEFSNIVYRFIYRNIPSI